MSLFTGASALGAALGVGGFNFLGASKQANAAEEGAALQAKAAEDALNFTKQLKAQQLTAAQPYLNMGQQAVGALPGMVRPMPSPMSSWGNLAMTPYLPPQAPR